MPSLLVVSGWTDHHCFTSAYPGPGREEKWPRLHKVTMECQEPRLWTWIFVLLGLSFLIWKMGKAIPPSSPRGPSHDCKYGPNSSAPNLMPHFTQERGVAPSPGSQSLTSLSRPTLWGDRSLPPPGRWKHGVGSSVERAQTPGAEATLRVGSSGPQDHVAGVTCQDTLSWGLTPECRRVPTHASRPRTRAPAPSVGWNVTGPATTVGGGGRPWTV